ncbi:MAG: hypothetical protein PQJ59_16845 [Spirochaetales bacterium]|nr:hypothetical protein [Spirochaetales bacterium]
MEQNSERVALKKEMKIIIGFIVFITWTGMWYMSGRMDGMDIVFDSIGSIG